MVLVSDVDALHTKVCAHHQNIIATMIQIMTGNMNKPMCQRNIFAFTFCNAGGEFSSPPRPTQMAHLLAQRRGVQT